MIMETPDPFEKATIILFKIILSVGFTKFIRRGMANMCADELNRANLDYNTFEQWVRGAETHKNYQSFMGFVKRSYFLTNK